MRKALIAIVLLAACGTEDDTVESGPLPLVNTAWAETDTGSTCSRAIAFGDGGVYRLYDVCLGTKDTYVENGTYDADLAAKVLTLRPTSASCRTAAVTTGSMDVVQRPGSGDMTFVGRTFVSIAPGLGTTDGLRTGCFEGGTFTPSPVSNL